MKIKLTVAYDGTEYCGWQIQPNGKTVQEALNIAVEKLTGEKTTVTGSGRTDAGVHAKGQVAHFETNANIPPEKFAKALNVFLPQDIRVYKSQKAVENFNACRSAKKKTYVYSAYQSEIVNPLKERYALRVDEGLNVNKMQSACKILEGKHDFKSFCSSGSSVQTTERILYKVAVSKKGQDIKITVCGNGFLYNMVRIIAGTLIKIGYGKMTEEELKKMLLSGQRNLGGNTLPAKGLCLEKVIYK